MVITPSINNYSINYKLEWLLQQEQQQQQDDGGIPVYNFPPSPILQRPVDQQQQGGGGAGRGKGMFDDSPYLMETYDPDHPRAAWVIKWILIDKNPCNTILSEIYVRIVRRRKKMMLMMKDHHDEHDKHNDDDDDERS